MISGECDSQHRRELALQGLVGGLGVGLVPLRGNLDQVAAAGWCGPACLRRVGVGDPGPRLGAGAGWFPCGTSDSGALALALADVADYAAAGGAALVRGGRAGFAAGGAAPSRPAWRAVGLVAATVNVLILRGSAVRHRAIPGAGRRWLLGDTLAGDGGLPFWFSGGNTTRGRPWH